MATILIATHNKMKKKELETILKEFDDINVITLDDVKTNPPVVVEDGKTFRQNAVKKAIIFSQFYNEFVLADDSGLEADALDGKPGVRSARFARNKATDSENNKKLLKLLEKIPLEERGARFVCDLAFAKDGTLLGDFEGTIRGRICLKPKGKNGFGYDPVFIPDGHNKTFAEMPASLKNQISHRALALKELKRSVRKYIDKPR